MPRIARIVLPTMPHHVTQRGNNRSEIFLDDEDRKVYLSLLRHYRSHHDCEVFAYCLMQNHVHLIIVPWAADSLALMLHDSHMRYAQYYNEKYSRTGHLWENRFYSAVMDDFHTLAATRYTELNPVRAGLVERAWDFAWSSARCHVQGVGDDGGILSPSWPSKEMLAQWRSILATDEKPTTDMIRQCTRKGTPLGSVDFVANLERLLGKHLQPRARGRPKMTK